MEDRIVVVTGAAGFIGSHLCTVLLDAGWRVHGVDNLSTGHVRNLAHLDGRSRFAFHQVDICDRLPAVMTDAVVHLATPASPTAFQRMPEAVLRAGSEGTLNVLGYARQRSARRVVYVSSSEVYGHPPVVPQPEDAYGPADPLADRAPYDEGKRFSETAVDLYRRLYEMPTGIVRLFSVYGPRMWPGDGRVVPAFGWAALDGGPLLVEGDGRQRRSLTYVDDVVAGLVAMLDSSDPGPINLGQPDTVTIGTLADTIIGKAGGGHIERRPGRGAEPVVRQPDITRARSLLGWTPTVGLNDGLDRTLAWMRSVRREAA